MSDLIKQIENVYAVLWDNKEFPICATLRAEVLPAIKSLQAEVDIFKEMKVYMDACDHWHVKLAQVEKEILNPTPESKS